MELFCTLLFLFMAGSVVGWVVELLFRRIAHKKWVNPGFLVGPCLPLYGFGLVLLYLFCGASFSFIASAAWRNVFIVASLTVLMTALEYVTGVLFIKLFNVRLWDYSRRWGNVNGVICPLFTAIWGAVGAAYLFLAHPLAVVAVEWFCQNTYLLLPLGAAYGVLAVDLAYSFRVVAKLRRWAAESNIVVKYELLKESIREKAKELKQKVSFLFPFRSKNGLKGEFVNYAEKHHRLKFSEKRKHDDD